MAECLSAKAKKLWKQLSKWGKDFDLEQWNFLAEFLELQDKIKAKGAVAKTDAKKSLYSLISHSLRTWLQEILDNCLSFEKRGIEIKVWKVKTTGLSSDAISPATMVILDSFIGIGTQLKTESTREINNCFCMRPD